MSPATLKLIHSMKPKHENALQVKQPSCSWSRWAAFLGRLSFLGCSSISIISILGKLSTSRNKMLPNPHALSGVGFLILGHWGSGPRPTQQHVPWSQDLGWGQDRRWLLLRSSLTRDIAFCHLTMSCLFVLPKSVEVISLLWLYFQALDQMATNFNNLAKGPSENGHSVKLKRFPSLVQSLLT